MVAGGAIAQCSTTLFHAMRFTFVNVNVCTHDTAIQLLLGVSFFVCSSWHHFITNFKTRQLDDDFRSFFIQLNATLQHAGVVSEFDFFLFSSFLWWLLLQLLFVDSVSSLLCVFYLFWKTHIFFTRLNPFRRFQIALSLFNVCFGYNLTGMGISKKSTRNENEITDQEWKLRFN